MEDGSLAELRHLTRISVDARVGQAVVGLEAIDGVHDVIVEGDRVRCQVDRPALNEAVRRLSAAGLIDLETRPPTLEELFLRHYERAADE